MTKLVSNPFVVVFSKFAVVGSYTNYLKAHVEIFYSENYENTFTIVQR